MRKLFWLLVCYTCALFILMGCRNRAVETTVVLQDIVEQPTIKDTLTIVAVGDIMLGSAFPDSSKLPPDDAVDSFKAVEIFLKGDIVFGNLEGCFLEEGDTTKCQAIDPNHCHVFRMPERYAGIIKKAGFNVLSLANNHVGDFGRKGRVNTAKILDSLNIHYAGQLNKPFDLFKIDNVWYAFVAFSPNHNTLDIRDIEKAKELVKELKEKSDIVLVSFHGGGEGTKFQHVTRETEFFHKENRGNVYNFAHAVIDAGADVVLGHGPHVTRAVEVYKNKFIAYSLGNFCTYGMFNIQGPNGIAPLLQLKIDAKGDFIYADVISVKQDKVNRLTVDDSHAAFHKMKYLTDKDFAGHNLRFENNKISRYEK